MQMSDRDSGAAANRTKWEEGERQGGDRTGQVNGGEKGNHPREGSGGRVGGKEYVRQKGGIEHV